MALQTPLVLISGAFSTLPPGDTIPGIDSAAQASGNAALVLASTAQASGNAGISTGLTALASGNAGISTGLTALASGNAGLVSASNKVPISGGYMTGQLFAASGVVVSGTLTVGINSVAAPSLVFTGDPNTGLFSPGADQLAISTNGTSRLAVSTTAVSSTLAVDVPLGASGTPSLTFTGDLNTGLFSPGADTLALVTAGTNRLHTTSAGNIGIGTTTPSFGAIDHGVHIYGSSAQEGIRLETTNGSAGILELYAESGGSTFDTRGSSYIRVNSSATEFARIDSSGRLLFGTTNTQIQTFSSASGVNINADGTIGASSAGTTLIINRTTSDGTVAGFNRAGNSVGSISVTTVLTTYNTSSDYRLKTVAGAVTGQGARIDALKPIDYFWTEGNQQARGFLAHEFQTVYANSVTGEKDAVDVDGNPVYQAMQASTSEVIADLVAEIQSLRTRVATLEAAENLESISGVDGVK